MPGHPGAQGNGRGRGWGGPGARADASAASEGVEDGVARLDHKDGAVRARAYGVLRAEARRGEIQGARRKEITEALIERVRHERQDDDFDSTPLLAIRLLGELRAAEAVPVLLEHLLDDFPRPVVTDADQGTPAARALAQIGPAAIPSLLDRAAAADAVEWHQVKISLDLMEDRRQVRDAVQRRSKERPDGREGERLRSLSER